MVRRIKQGLPSMSRRGQYGYDPAVLRSDPPTINEEEARWVRWMFARRLEGWGGLRIAQGLDDRGVRTARGGRWSVGSVHSILANPLYRGAVNWGGHVNEKSRVPAIVDADTWHRAQQPLVRAYRRNPRALTGLARCALCGGRMAYFSPPRRNDTFLRCGRYAATGGRQCESNGMMAGPVEEEVLRVVRKVLYDPTQYAHYVEPLDNNAGMRASLESNLARIQAAAERWARAYEQGAIGLAEFRERREGLDGQVETITGELAALEVRARRRAAAEERLGGLGALLDDLDDCTPAEMNAFLRLIVERVVCRKGETPDVLLL